MSLWGKTTAAADKPKYLTAAQKTDTELTGAGWVYTQANGTKELLVALGDPDLTPIPAAPVNTTAPVITGTATTGSTLTVTPGVWTGTPAPTITRQWKRGATNIAGATGLTYVLVVADEGANITCVETGTNATGSSTGTSNAIGPIAAA